jgi:hypothetical protein
MPMRYLIYVFFTLLVCNACAQDTLYLNSGSVLAGKFKTADLGTVSFDIKDAGIVSIQLEKIKTIHVESKLLKVETMFKQTLIGYLHYHNNPGMVWFYSYTDTIPLFLTTVVSAVAFDKSFLNAINAYVGAGYSYTRSSDVGRLNLDARLNYTLQKIDANFVTSFIATQENSNTFVRDRENISLTGNYYYTNMWFNQASLNYQRNLQLGLIRRTQQGISIGNRFFTRTNMQAKFLVGYAINQETNTEGFNSGTLSEIPISLLYNFYRFDKPKFILSISEIGYVGINQSGRIRQDGDMKLTWKFWGDFSLTANIYHNYDSRPPVTGKPNLDYGLVFTAGYEFK